MKKSSKRFVLSDESKNLHGFVTITSGIDLSDFANNPVMLYSHDYDKVLGQWTDWQVEGTKLTAVPMFDENDPFAMLQYSKVEQGILKGASIGIAPIQYDEATATMLQSSLKETSLTPVPSNRKALSIALYNNEGIKLSDTQAREYLLSLQPKTEELTPKQNMNQNLITALVALCVQAGHTINLSAQSTDPEIELAIKKVGEKLSSLNSTNVELSAKVTGFENAAKAAAEKEITDLVDGAINTKCLSADQRTAFVELGRINLSALKVSLSALKPAATVEIPGTPPETSKNTTEQANWTFDDFALKAPNDLEKMQRQEPERFQKLLSAKQQAVRSTGTVAL